MRFAMRHRAKLSEPMQNAFDAIAPVALDLFKEYFKQRVGTKLQPAEIVKEWAEDFVQERVENAVVEKAAEWLQVVALEWADNRSFIMKHAMGKILAPLFDEFVEAWKLENLKKSPRDLGEFVRAWVAKELKMATWKKTLANVVLAQVQAFVPFGTVAVSGLKTGYSVASEIFSIVGVTASHALGAAGNVIGAASDTMFDRITDAVYHSVGIGKDKVISFFNLETVDEPEDGDEDLLSECEEMGLGEDCLKAPPGFWDPGYEIDGDEFD